MAVVSLAFGWGLGFLLAAPYILPVLEYTRTSARIASRAAGHEEHPPVGLSALPQVVLPDMYGAEQAGTVRLGRDYQIESTAAAYTGAIATLLLAPLAWCSRRHRSFNVFWLVLALFSLSWALNLPGFVSLLRLPGLKIMPHNRLVFLAAFAFLAMTAVGLEVLRHRPITLSRWFWLPAALAATLFVWCLYRVCFLPEDVDERLGRIVAQFGSYDWIHDMNGVLLVQGWFVQRYALAALACGIALAGWLFLRFRQEAPKGLLPLAGVLLMGDLLWFAHGRNAQCDPALYYPRVPILEKVRNSTPGRVFGYNCFPAGLAMMCGLRDIRGYDAIDPARLIDLMAIACHPASEPSTFALTAGLTPKMEPRRDGGVQLSPVLDMLNVRYILFRGSGPQDTHPGFQGNDYWVLVNSNALPRAYVPSHVEVTTNAAERLEKLSAPTFNPHETAYVEAPVSLPPLCRGTAEIIEEVPTRIKMALHMDTPGLVVLADLWDGGWLAYLNGKPLLVLRANHAVRGVVVPAGQGFLEFRYQPASFAWGLRLSALSAALLLGWTMSVCRVQLKSATELE
jgi:hypothetical protein